MELRLLLSSRDDVAMIDLPLAGFIKGPLRHREGIEERVKKKKKRKGRTR